MSKQNAAQEERIFTPGLAPRGMAVDNKNNRLYAYNETTNQIVVYGTVTGELLAAIGNSERMQSATRAGLESR